MALATIAFFASFVFDSGAMLFGTDMLSQAYQSRAFAVQEVQAGRGLPQWNPFVYGGLPYLSSSVSVYTRPRFLPRSKLHRAIGGRSVHSSGEISATLARELGLRPNAAVLSVGVFTGCWSAICTQGRTGMFA
jgi:hypothetical protein